MAYPHPLETPPRFPDIVDSTMRADFVGCPQKFYQGYILKRSLAGGSIHLVAGGAYAKGLDLIRTWVYGPEQLDIDKALVRAIPYVWAEYGDYPVPEGYEHKGPIRVVQALVAYFDKYHPERDHIKPYIKKDGFPATEFSFTLETEVIHPETGMPILYAGRTDMVGVYNDSLWIVDDKTATQLGSSWDSQFALRAQLTGYCFAAHAYGLPVSGAIVRGISFLKTGAFGFSEPIEYRSNWQMERWWNQLHRDLRRMVACWEEKSEEFPYGYWDWNLAEVCNEFGGCPFRQLCKVSNPDQLARGAYEFRDWSPLDLNPTGRAEVKNVIAS